LAPPNNAAPGALCLDPLNTSLGQLLQTNVDINTFYSWQDLHDLLKLMHEFHESLKSEEAAERTANTEEAINTVQDGGTAVSRTTLLKVGIYVILHKNLLDLLDPGVIILQNQPTRQEL